MIQPTTLTLSVENPDAKTATEAKVIASLRLNSSIRAIAQQTGLSFTAIMQTARKLANRGIVAIG